MTLEMMKQKFEAFLLTERRVTENTFAAYQRDVGQFVDFLNKEKIDIQTITATELKHFIHFLYGLKLTASSIARKISALKTFFSYLNMHFNIKNWAKELHFPKIEKKLPTYLTEDEMQHLLSYTQQDRSSLGNRNMVMLYLLYVSGMRVSELVNLKVSDIHFDTCVVRVNGKGGKQRMIPLPLPMLSLLRTYLEKTHNKLVNNSNALQEKMYLFPIIYGKKIKPISRQSCWGILKKLCVSAGITRSISPHQFRHSLATHMLQKGADLRSLQVLLGHEGITTVQVYTHVEISQLRKMYDKKHPRS